MRKNNSIRGFTLLELLVVVAIIGLLTSVVLALLSNARKKGQDSGIKTEMTSLRTQADLYATSNSNSYANLFTTGGNGGTWWVSADTSVQAILASIDKISAVHTAGSSASAWAAQAQLKEDPTKYICLDSTGIFKVGGTVLTAGDTVCP